MHRLSPQYDFVEDKIVESIVDTYNRRINPRRGVFVDWFAKKTITYLEEAFPQFVWTFHAESIHPIRAQRINR